MASELRALLSTRVTRDGLRQRTRTWRAVGERVASVVVVHGIGEHSGRYDRLALPLARAGFEVRAHDLRGHGETSGPVMDVPSFDRFLDDVEDELARARQETGGKVALFGHSFGGLIATTYAVGDRPQPDALVLSAPALDATLSPFLRFAVPVLGRLLPALKVGSPVQPGQLSRDPEVERAYFADPLVRVKGSARLGAEALGAMQDTSRKLDRLRVPTFVLHGGQDPLVPARFSEPLAELAGVERKVYEPLRHESFHEPEGPAVVADIAAFLRRTLLGAA